LATESEIEALLLRTGSIILEDWYSDLIEVLKKINTEAKEAKEKAEEAMKAKPGTYDYPGLFWFNAHWLPEGCMETSIGGSGHLWWRTESVRLATGTTEASWAGVIKAIVPDNATWEKERRILFKIQLYQLSFVYIHLVSGHIERVSTLENTHEHIGFKIDGATLYATVADGVGESILNLGTLSSRFYELEAVFTPGVECRFYVNGEDKGAITTNLPSGTGYAELVFMASIFNREAAEKEMELFEVRFMQAG